MNDGKHKENYWLIKSPIFKRFFQFFSREKKRERAKKFARALWTLAEKKEPLDCGQNGARFGENSGTKRKKNKEPDEIEN